MGNDWRKLCNKDIMRKEGKDVRRFVAINIYYLEDMSNVILGALTLALKHCDCEVRVV